MFILKVPYNHSPASSCPNPHPCSNWCYITQTVASPTHAFWPNFQLKLAKWHPSLVQPICSAVIQVNMICINLVILFGSCWPFSKLVNFQRTAKKHMFQCIHLFWPLWGCSGSMGVLYYFLIPQSYHRLQLFMFFVKFISSFVLPWLIRLC